MSIKFQEVSYTYSPSSKFAFNALKNISLEFEMNKITALIGHTGSGKSTLVQQLNALLIPTSGTLEVCDFIIKNDKKKNKNLKSLRKRVGLVFQFPEYQLFEETVAKDIGFGPKNFGVSEEEINDIVKKVIVQVGLDESYLERSPLELSGGQKRRVAIAGILAMNPDVLVLDEPTAGLDPNGAKAMLDLFVELNRLGKTIIIVTHEMDYVLEYCDLCVVLNKGNIVYEGTPINLFVNDEIMNRVGIEPPLSIEFAKELQKNGFELNLYNIKDEVTLSKEIIRTLKGGAKYE